MRRLKVIAVGSLLICVGLVLFLFWHAYKSNAPVSTEELFRDDEAAQARRAADNFVSIIQQTATTYAARGAHAKGHACVKAYLQVEEMPDDGLQHGIFSLHGHRYKTWIRFSNGSSDLVKSDDRRKDSRGMAIKVFNTQARAEDWVEGSALTQDFLMHSNPVFFSANVDDYNALVESDNKILSFFDSWNPLKWRIRELMHVFDTLAPPPPSPLEDEYFSNTAYRLGPHNIKFRARPCAQAARQKPKSNNDHPDFLSRVMAEQLQHDSACFEFQVQLQVPGKNMPIEDPSVEWQETDSPWRRVASIEIPKQDFNNKDQSSLCENLSFSPWNSLTVHRPLGELNRIRKQVYEASSTYRHRANNTSVPSNIAW